MPAPSLVRRFRVTKLMAPLLIAALASTAACSSKKAGDTATSAQAVPLQAPSVGATHPKVDVLAFVDFECPFCRSQARTLLDAAAKHPDDVRLRFFNLPLDVHPNSVLGARGAVAAWRQGKYDAYYAKFMADTPLSRDAIIQWGRENKFDVAKLAVDMDSPETDKIIKRDVSLAKALGVAGTPSFVVNGTLVQGVQTAPVWDKRLGDEIIRADGILAAGGKREDLAKAIVTANNPKGAPEYVRFVLNGEPAPEAPVPAKVARTSGVASATIAPAGGAQGIQVGEPVQLNPDQNDSKTVWRVAIRPDDPAMGPAAAGVTLVVFEDMECPFCAKLRPTLAKLREQYAGTLRVVFKHNPLPFHTHAEAAAEALEAARLQGKFWEMHDYLLQHQDKLDDVGLQAAADAIKLNRPQFDTAMAAHGGRDRIEADIEQASALGARGTPNLFVNGRKLVGAKEEGVIKPLIDEEDKHAEAVAHSGVPKDGVYEAIISKGKLLDSLSPEEKKIDVTGAPSRGPAGAAVQIVAFQDFQCPFSARLDPHMAEIEKEFEGRVRVTWMDFPLRTIHPMAEMFAEAGQEAQKQGKFWAFHKAVMADNGALSADVMITAAKKAGMDVKALQNALDKHTWVEAVEKQHKLGESLGVKGTPSVFINGHQFVPQTGFSAGTFRGAVRRLLGTR
jgi:protein-disulfide isomerase